MREINWLALAGVAIVGCSCADVSGYGGYPGYGYGGYSGYGSGYGGGYAQSYYPQRAYYQPTVVTSTRYVSTPASTRRHWHHRRHHRDGDHDHDRH
jgi:hypothetical protein